MGKALIDYREEEKPASNDNDGKKLTKEEKEKLKKKNRKQRQKNNKKTKKTNNLNNHEQETHPSQPNSHDIEIEYVEKDEYLLTGKYYEEFKNVFQYFATPKTTKGPAKNDYDETYSDNEENMGQNARFDQENGQKDRDQIKELKLSRKKRKQLKMLKVAQLKALVKRPDVVEVFLFIPLFFHLFYLKAWDVTSPDPLLLVYLKSYKNTVPVPRHWCQKRKFLQNKRGILKPPFKLPSFFLKKIII